MLGWHLIAVSRAMKCPDVLPLPDIITDAGRQTWVRAMGVRAAAQAVRFAKLQAGAKVIFGAFYNERSNNRQAKGVRAGYVNFTHKF